MHGFDEFFGNLYHLNAEEEPEHPDYPKDPEFKKRFGPRGVLHCKADGNGGQTDRGHRPADEEADGDHRRRGHRACAALHRRSPRRGPAVLHVVEHHRHALPHPLRREAPGQEQRSRRLQRRDGRPRRAHRRMLDKLDELGIADDTIVMYSTDNGPHYNSWPDAGITPFRSEKNTNWEGGWRVPAFLRWPGHIPAGSVRNGSRVPPGLAADAAGGGRGAGHRRRSCSTATPPATRPSTCTSTATTCCPT